MAILLEDGTAILLEDGTELLLETEGPAPIAASASGVSFSPLRSRALAKRDAAFQRVGSRARFQLWKNTGRDV